MNRLFLLFLLFLCPAIPARGDAEKPGGTKVKVRLLAVVVPPDLGRVHLVYEGGKSPDLDLPANNVSEALEVSGRTMQMKTSAKDIPLCNITLPEAGKRFVVILTPATPSGYTAHVIRTDDPSFRKGDCFFLNLTRKSIIGKLGTKKLSLESGKSEVSRPEGAREGNFYDIAFASRGDDGDRILSTSRWPVDEQIRSYLFFIENGEGHITYRAVDEFVTEEK